jgi:SAM-dependent methyltransferase
VGAAAATATAAWSRLLEARAIPAEIVAAAPVSPYGFSPEAFARRTEALIGRELRLPGRRALEALPEGGHVLDVGVGTGSASLPLVPRAGRIVGVDIDEGMLREFRRIAASVGVAVETVLGPWPEVAPLVPEVDVAVCHSVLYGVAHLAPFVGALSSHARRRVVLLIPDRQWLAWQDDLWARFHGVTRPPAATAADAVAALRELGVPVQREDETLPPVGGLPTREQVVAEVRTRLCLPPERDAELEAALGERLHQRDGQWVAGPPGDSVAVTLWWDTTVSP